MAFFLNGVKVVDTTGWNVPTLSSRPASPVEGQVIWNTSSKKLEMFDAGYWVTMTDVGRPSYTEQLLQQVMYVADTRILHHG